MSGTPCDAGTESVLGQLLEASKLLAPDAIAGAVARVARGLPARDVVVYLVDYEQVRLVPLGGEGLPRREPLGIDSTLAGRAFRFLDVVESSADRGHRLWVPLLDGPERLGIMELTVPEIDERVRRRCQLFASLAAELIVAKNAYGDALERARRSREMSLAAEIQWELLPPLTFATEQVTVSGVLHPCYRIGGDVFDYAVNGPVAHLMILDAMGHGLQASLTSSLALGAYRHSRRRMEDLAATYRNMDAAVAAQFGPERFATAILAELHCATGHVRWLNAGHPLPLLLRGGRVVGSLPCEPSLPVGFGGGVAELAEAALEPGDRLLFYTDGVIEARSADGEMFGQERLSEFVVKQSAAGQPTPELMRRVSHAILAYQHGELQDDATTLFLEWRGRTGAA